MTTITINGFIQAKPAREWEAGESNVHNGAMFTFWQFKDLKSSGYTNVTSASVTFEVPEDFDIRTGAIEALIEKKRALQAEFQKSITDIEEQINRYTAIEA